MKKKNRQQTKRPLKEERVGYRNGEGYVDPTAYVALNRVVMEKRRQKKTLTGQKGPAISW